MFCRCCSCGYITGGSCPPEVRCYCIARQRKPKRNRQPLRNCFAKRKNCLCISLRSSIFKLWYGWDKLWSFEFYGEKEKRLSFRLWVGNCFKPPKDRHHNVMMSVAFLTLWLNGKSPQEISLKVRLCHNAKRYQFRFHKQNCVQLSDVRLVTDIKSNGAGTQNERQRIEECFGKSFIQM